MHVQRISKENKTLPLKVKAHTCLKQERQVDPFAIFLLEHRKR